MTLGDDSYGSVAGVAAIAYRWTKANTFDLTTTPTKIQTEKFIDQVSALMNSLLAEEGFDIPVTDSTVKLILDMFVNGEVASIVLGLHGSGRFAPKGGKSAGQGKSRFAMILEDFADYLKTYSYSLLALGASGDGGLIILTSDNIEALIDRVSQSWAD